MSMFSGFDPTAVSQFLANLAANDPTITGDGAPTSPAGIYTPQIATAAPVQQYTPQPIIPQNGYANTTSQPITMTGTTNPGFVNSIGSQVLGANTNTVANPGYPLYPSSVSSPGTPSSSVQTPPPVPAPWQQQEAAVAQLAANQQNRQVLNQFNKMYGLAGANAALQYNQNNQLTNQQQGQAENQLIASGFGGSTAYPTAINNAQSLGQMRAENIGANAAQQNLGILQAKAQALQSMSPSIPAGGYSPSAISGIANTLYGNAANTVTPSYSPPALVPLPTNPTQG